MNKKTVLITGATAGIGLETARLFAQSGFRLILTGRRNDRLQSIERELNGQTEVLTLQFDIRIREEVEKAMLSLPQEWQRIDILLNNAGLAAGLAPIQSAEITDWEQMIDTNIKGLLYITRLVTPGMIERGTGHIINLSSIAGKEAYANGSVYCGTKHAVSAISQSMRLDLLRHNIKVTSICPGAVETEFSLVRFKGDEEKAAKVYEGYTPLSAHDIAETILFIATRPAHVNIDDILIMPTAQGLSRDVFRQ